MSRRPLWTAAEVAAATGGQAHGDFEAFGVSIDSRAIEAGDLFVALAGDNFDGHAFVAEALGQGAAGALVARVPPDCDDRALVVVDDTLRALTRLGAAARARTQARTVAVTGSVGKTGTKDMIARALAPFGMVQASRGGLNNHVGLPLSLARLAPDCDFAVLEMGMNHAGEIAHLTRLARPHVSVITTVEPVHAAHFRGITEIAEAKGEIFQGMGADGVAVLYRDNPCYRQLVRAAHAQGLERIITFGEFPDCEVRLEAYTPIAGHNRVEATVAGDALSYELALDGRHWAIDSLAVLAAVSALDLDAARAAATLAGAVPPAGRGSRFTVTLAGGPIEVIDDSYNASPPSVRAALAVLATAVPGHGGRRVLVLGDMLELGDDAARLHAQLAPDVEREDIDLVFTAGPLARALHEALPAARRGTHAGSAHSLAEPLAEALRPGDVVLVKGSRGSAMDRVVHDLKARDVCRAGEPGRRAANGGA